MTVNETQERLNTVTEAVAEALDRGASCEAVRRAIIDGVLDVCDYDSAGLVANKIVNVKYR